MKTKRLILLGLGTAMLALGILEIGPSLLNGIFYLGGFVVLGEGVVRLGVEVSKNADQAWKVMADMIRDAEIEILLTTGTFNPNAFIKWNNGEINRLLDEKIKAGVQVEVICGEHISQESRETLRNWTSKYPNFRLYRYPGNPTPHAMLVDNKLLRVEKPHLTRPEVTKRENVFMKHPGVAAGLILNTMKAYRTQAVRLVASDL